MTRSPALYVVLHYLWQKVLVKFSSVALIAESLDGLEWYYIFQRKQQQKAFYKPHLEAYWNAASYCISIPHFQLNPCEEIEWKLCCFNNQSRLVRFPCIESLEAVPLTFSGPQISPPSLWYLRSRNYSKIWWSSRLPMLTFPWRMTILYELFPKITLKVIDVGPKSVISLISKELGRGIQETASQDVSFSISASATPPNSTSAE